MKNKAAILVLFVILSGCSTGQYAEGKLTKTKAYCGKAVNTRCDGEITVIQTTMIIFSVKGSPDVPKGAYCYIRRIPCYQNVTKSMKEKLEPKYFSWDNSKEYRVKGSVPYKLFN